MALANQERDAVNDALSVFAENPVKEIPEELEKLLTSIATTGRAKYPWGKIKLLLVQKLENVIEEYLKENPDESVPLLPNVENVPFGDMKQRLLTNINKFKDAPFTIQRICELLVSPKKYYMQRDKFMRGIEKNILIVTTVTPTGKRITSVSNGPPMVNGILPPENIPNGTQPKESQFKVPSSPGDARQQPSSIGESSTPVEPPHTETTEEPSPKRIKLQDLPDQSKESPSTSDDRIPSSEMDVPLNDGVSSINDSKSNNAVNSDMDDTLLTVAVNSSEAASTHSGGSTNEDITSQGAQNLNNVVSSEAEHITSDSVFSNVVTSNNEISSNNGVSSDGKPVPNNGVVISQNDEISDQNGVSSNNDITDSGTDCGAITDSGTGGGIITDSGTVSEAPAPQVTSEKNSDSGVGEISRLGESTDAHENAEIGQSTDSGVGGSSADTENGTMPPDSECQPAEDSLSSEAMDTTETVQGLGDQSNPSAAVHTGVESSSEVTTGPVAMESEAGDSGADEGINSGTEEAGGQTSEEEMEVQSSTQVTELPAAEEETNEAMAAKQNQEGGE